MDNNSWIKIFSDAGHLAGVGTHAQCSNDYFANIFTVWFQPWIYKISCPTDKLDVGEHTHIVCSTTVRQKAEWTSSFQYVYCLETVRARTGYKVSSRIIGSWQGCCGMDINWQLRGKIQMQLGGGSGQRILRLFRVKWISKDWRPESVSTVFFLFVFFYTNL